MIYKLKQFEESNLDLWYNMNSTEQEKFSRKFVDYADNNKTEVINYCKSIKPREFCVLEVVYESFTNYSFKWNDFIFDEIKRLVNLAINKSIKPKSLSIIFDIDFDDIFEKDYKVYKKIIDFMLSKLNARNSEALNKKLLDIIGFYFIELERTEVEWPAWELKLKKFGKLSSKDIQQQVDEILTDNDKSKRKFNFLAFQDMTEVIISVLILTGIIATTLSIDTFRITLIDINESLMIFFGMGVLGFIVLLKALKKEYNIFLKFIIGTIVFGGISIFSFLYLNKNLASDNQVIINNRCEIIEKSALKSSKSDDKPTIKINILGLEKQILFHNSKIDEVAKANYVEVLTKRGFFGYPVILETELKDF